MAWEQRYKVAILVPHTGNITTEWGEFFFNKLVKPKNSIIMLGRGTPIDVCRESMVESAIEQGATHIFFIDSDVIPDRSDVIPYLIGVMEATGADLVSGIYWTKQSTPVLSAWVKTKNGYVTISPHQESNYVEVDAVGLGCALINSKVFTEKIDKPWFFWWNKREYMIPMTIQDLKKIAEGDRETLNRYIQLYENSLKGSEDYFLCEKIRMAGGKIVVCMDLKCSHVGGYKISGEGRVTTPSI